MHASSSSRSTELKLLALAFIGLVPVLHIAHATGLRNTLAAVIAAGTLFYIARHRDKLPFVGLVIAWLLFGAASAFWSPDAEITMKSVLTDIVMPVGAFYAAYLASQQSRAFRAAAIVVLASVAVIAAFTMIAFIADLTDQLVDERRAGPIYYYPGPGVASTLAVYAVPFALLSATDTSRRQRYTGYGGLLCILLAGLGSTNRMFWLTLAAALATFYLWQLPRYGSRQRSWIWLAVVGLAGIAAVMVNHLNEFRDPRDQALDVRLEGWRQWGAIAGDAPLHGHGLGRRIARDVLADRLPERLATLDQRLLSHGHNYFLNVLLQIGLLGLGVLCALLAGLLRVAYKARDPVRLREGAALTTLLVAMLAKNFTDDFMDQAVVIAFWLYAGLLLGRVLPAERRSV